MVYVITSFQFSEVSMMKQVIRASIVPEKAYLDGVPSVSASRGLVLSPKNYFVNKAEMKRYNRSKIPKLEIAAIEPITVVNKTLSVPQDLIILKILKILKALNTASFLFPAGMQRST